jgi:Tripartite tricarboxylate transporter TctB family
VTNLSDASSAPAPGSKRPRVVSARRGGLSAAIALLFTGIVFAWQSMYLDFGDVGLPGPGFFPFWLGIVLAGCAGVIIIEIVRSHEEQQPVELGHRDVLIAWAAMLGVPVFFEPLGTYLTLGLFGVALLVFIGKVHLLRAVAGSAIGMVAVWYFFKVLFGLQLPNGPF